MAATMDSIRRIDAETLPQTPLQTALLRHAPQILDSDDVAAYQLKAAKESDDRRYIETYGVRSPRPSKWRSCVADVIPWLLVTLMASSTGIIILSLALEHRIPWVPVAATVLCWIASGPCWKNTSWAPRELPEYRRAKWFSSTFDACGDMQPGARVVLHDYGCPPAALESALAIRAEALGTEILIEHLDEDPFLAVELGDEKYYICAWNEGPPFDR